MKLALDTETSVWSKGNPFARRNHMCCVALRKDHSPSVCIPWEWGDAPLSVDSIASIDVAIDNASLLIFFNAKFDLHWLRRCGIIPDYRNLKIWDCQLAQFIIGAQQERYPSLDSSCAFFGLGQKSKVVEEEFWNKGVDTDFIPWEILSEYACKDVDLTWELYLKQKEYLADKPALLRLIKLSCMDTLVLAEMEFQGLRYDVEESLRRAGRIDVEIAEIDKTLTSVLGRTHAGATGSLRINFNSPEQVSAMLYGGIVSSIEQVPYIYTYKDGTQKQKTKTTKIETTLPRLVTPLDRTELKKQGYWSTDDSTLRRLKATGVAKRVVGLITKRNELERLVSTYYRGLPKIMEEKDWEPGEIHGQFNQVTVVTGRTSSSGPNLQNLAPEVEELVKTRF